MFRVSAAPSVGHAALGHPARNGPSGRPLDATLRPLATRPSSAAMHRASARMSNPTLVSTVGPLVVLAGMRLGFVGSSMFVAKLNPLNLISWSQSLGFGGTWERAFGVAVDAGGNIASSPSDANRSRQRAATAAPQSYAADVYFTRRLLSSRPLRAKLGTRSTRLSPVARTPSYRPMHKHDCGPMVQTPLETWRPST